MASIPPKYQKNEPYAQTGEQMRKFSKYMDDAIKSAIKQYPDVNTGAGKLGYTHNGHAYVKKPGSAKVVPAIMSWLVAKGGADRTQKAILDDVRKELPNQDIQDNVWFKELKGWQLKKLQEKIYMSRKFEEYVEIKGCKTLSDIKKRLKVSTNIIEADYNAKANVSVKGDNLVVGKKTYLISDRKSGIYTYQLVKRGTG
jgi:hypothetical protein